jgi:hypothetical protein
MAARALRELEPWLEEVGASAVRARIAETEAVA